MTLGELRVSCGVLSGIRPYLSQDIVKVDLPELGTKRGTEHDEPTPASGLTFCLKFLSLSGTAPVPNNSGLERGFLLDRPTVDGRQAPFQYVNICD
jgi:hypothetical protein